MRALLQSEAAGWKQFIFTSFSWIFLLRALCIAVFLRLSCAFESPADSDSVGLGRASDSAFLISTQGMPLQVLGPHFEYQGFILDTCHAEAMTIKNSEGDT